MDPIDAVMDVRARMGYAPLPNPLVIQGPRGSEPPPLEPEPDSGPWEGDVIQKLRQDQEAEGRASGGGEESPQGDAAGQGPPRSPLIPRPARRVEPPRLAPVQESQSMLSIPMSELIVSGHEAIYKGQAYVLDEQAIQEVAVAVLRAAKRLAEERMAELTGPPRRLVQLAAAATMVNTGTPNPAPRRPGRPKGSKNRPKVQKEAVNAEPVGADEVPPQ